MNTMCIVGKESAHEQVTSKAPMCVEGYCLLLPGRQLHLHVLQAKKFRNRGNKDCALSAFRALENDGLGKLEGENPVS